MKNIRLDLRIRAIIGITVIVISVVMILSLFFINNAKRIIRADLKQLGLVLARNLAYNSEYGMLTSNPIILGSLIEGIVKQPQVAYGFVQDPQGNVLVSQGLNEHLRVGLLDADQRALEIEGYLIQSIKTLDGKSYYDIAVPIISGVVEAAGGDELELFQGEEEWSQGGGFQKKIVMKKIGIVRVGLSLASVAVLEKKSQQVVMFITIPIIFVAGLITTFLTNITVSPIRKLVEGTRRIARGDLNFQVQLRETDELGQLADSFNKMTQDLRKSRDELLHAKDYTDNIIKSMIDILVVVDPKGNIQTVNPATIKALGYDEKELIGQPVEKIFTLGENQKSPKSFIIRKLLQEGFINDYEMAYKTKKGESLPVIFSGAVMTDKFGRLEGIVGIAKDIRDRKRTEEALQQSHDRFNTLAANVPGMIYQFLLDPDGQMTFPYVSPGCRELFGEEPETFYKDASTVINMIHPSDRSGFDGSVAISAKTLEPWRWEGRFIKKGETKWIQCASRPKKQPDGGVLWDGLIIDITKRKRFESDLKKAQGQLVQSEKLASIGQLAAGIAHEINNPLGFVGSNLSTLKDYIQSLLTMIESLNALKKTIENKDFEQVVQDEKQLVRLEEKMNLQNVLEDIDNLMSETQNGIERISMIVRDLRTFSRDDTQTKAPADLNTIFQGVRNIVWNEIKYKAELKQECQDIPLVECNAQQIGQVFINLLVNAAQAIEGKGVITFKTYSEGKKVYVEVQDTGKGIPEEIVGKIFDPFFTTKEVGQGTGLGLSISYEIVKKNAGDIEVKSEVGKGTAFILSFPAKT